MAHGMALGLLPLRRLLEDADLLLSGRLGASTDPTYDMAVALWYRLKDLYEGTEPSWPEDKRLSRVIHLQSKLDEASEEITRLRTHLAIALNTDPNAPPIAAAYLKETTK